MKKVLFLTLLLFLFILGTVNITGQVTIGSSSAPHKSAVLDLSQIAGNKLGFLLPQVSLIDKDTFSLPVDGTSTSGAATGMMVYNTHPALPLGIYIWDGTEWKSVGGDVNADCQTLQAGYVLPEGGTLNAKQVKVEVTSGGTAPITYTWYQKGKDGAIRIRSNTSAQSDSCMLEVNKT